MAVNRAVSSQGLVNQRPLPVLGAAHNTRSSRHSTKSSRMGTSRPRFTLFPVTSGLRLMIGGSAGQRDRHSDTRPGAQGHPARPAAAVHAGLGDGFTGHVGMAQDLARSGVEAARPDDCRPLEVLPHAGPLHRERGRPPRRRRQVLPGDWRGLRGCSHPSEHIPILWTRSTDSMGSHRPSSLRWLL